MGLHSVCASSIVLSPPHQKETRNRVSAKRSLWPRCKDSWSRSFSFPTLGLRFRIQGPPAQALPAPGCLSHTELPLSDDGRPSGPRAGSESAPRGPPRPTRDSLVPSNSQARPYHAAAPPALHEGPCRAAPPPGLARRLRVRLADSLPSRLL